MEFSKLPISIKQTIMQGSTYSEYNNVGYLYSVIAEGECATFLVIDIKTNTIQKQFDLEGATGSWTTTVASDNRVYIGSYDNGGLYRYDHKKDQIEILFDTLPGAKFIYNLQSDDENNIYGGTWPNCALFKYNGKEERLEFLKDNLVESEAYIRTLAVDKQNKKVFAGIGTHAHLIEFDEKTGIKKNILPDKYKTDAFCTIIGYQENKLAVYSNKQKEAFILNTLNHEVIKTTSINEISQDIPKDVNCENFYVNRKEDGLIIVDLTTNEFYQIKPESKQMLMRGFSINGGTQFLYTTFDGDIYIYDVLTKQTTKQNIDIPRKDIEIRQIYNYKNKLYGGGYLIGGTFAYDIEKNTNIQYDGIGQSEGIIAHNDKLYIGKYPNAIIYEYDLTEAWSKTNPKELFSLKRHFNQDRPFALEIYDEQLFIGTIPNYGSTKGSLAICDLQNKKFAVLENFIDNQSIVSLKEKDGILYGGTTVCGGLGSYTIHESGTLFAYDIKKKKKLFEITPVKGRKNIGGIYITQDNLLLACADTTLFIYDLTTNQKIYEQYVCVHNPEKDYKWEISFIKKGTKGLYYIVTGNRLFSFDIETKELTQIMKEKVNLLQIDDSGHLYMQYMNDVRHVIKSIESV